MTIYTPFFGIPQLDLFLNPSRSPEESPANQSDEDDYSTWQTAIVGPDGVGKSVLAMHLAANHMVRSRQCSVGGEPPTQVVYFSTDLSALQAKTTWSAFCLGDIVHRTSRLNRSYPDIQQWVPSASIGEVELNDCQPSNEAGLRQLFGDGTVEAAAVSFFDLQRETTGDDWSFINRVIGQLPEIGDGRTADAYHLVVIDAVEGLEAIVGEKDSFGEKRTRRSRIAQLIRTCVRKGVHLVMTIEEPRDDERLPEQFVADLVIRLRQTTVDEFGQRTIEVEKCRSVPHVRGEHELTIRSGSGSSTGDFTNFDDPKIEFRGTRGQLQHLAHVHIVPSLHYWNHKVRLEKGSLPRVEGMPSFGLPTLDGLFAAEQRQQRWTEVKDPRPEASRKQSVSLLIGDAGTAKSRLGICFLAEAFAHTRRTDNKPVDSGDQGTSDGYAVLLSSSWDERTKLVRTLVAQAGEAEDLEKNPTDLLEEVLNERTACRRISVRHMTGAHLICILECYVHRAQRKLMESFCVDRFNDEVEGRELLRALNFILRHDSVNTERERERRIDMLLFADQDDDSLRTLKSQLEILSSQGRSKDKEGLETALKELARPAIERRRSFSFPIRVVLDDWAIIRQTHPAIDRDPMVLQSILAILQREGVTSLIISTQSGVPTISDEALDKQDLRQLDFPKLLTWAIDFYGQRRVAVSLAAARSSRSTRVYELRRRLPANDPSPLTGGLVVDRHFELYADLGLRTVRRVPLIVRLYGGTDAEVDTPVTTGVTFKRLVDKTLSQIFPRVPSSDVIRYEYAMGYDDFGTFSDWLDDSRTDHTLVFQIDEFWSDDSDALADMTHYYCGQPLSRWDEDSKEWTTLITSDEADRPDRHRVYSTVSTSATQDSVDRTLFTPEITRRYETNSNGGLQTPAISEIEGECGTRNELVRRDFFHDERQAAYEHLLKQSAATSNQDAQVVPPSSFRRQQLGRVDRIPYLWDFGVLLVRTELWNACRDELLPQSLAENIGPLWSWPRGSRVWRPWGEGSNTPSVQGRPRTVGDVFDRLALPDDATQTEFEKTLPGVPSCVRRKIGASSAHDLPYWAEFFAACEIVADRFGCRPFTVDQQTPESLSSLLLEIWASEAFLINHPDDVGFRSFEQLFDLKCDKVNLDELVAMNPLSLYMAISRLVHACRYLKVSDQHVYDGDPQLDYAARREWYSTASHLMRAKPDHEWTVLGLPGIASTRGDWSLATSKGSRSQLLAEQAIDLLNSRHMAQVRLRDGIGLPVRDIAIDSCVGRLQTALTRNNRHKGITREPLSYEEVCSLGATSSPNVANQQTNPAEDGVHDRNAVDDVMPGDRPFAWIWRSQISNYQKSSSLFRRTIAQLFDRKVDWLRSEIFGSLMGEVVRRLQAEDPDRTLKASADSPRLEQVLQKLEDHYQQLSNPGDQTEIKNLQDSFRTFAGTCELLMSSLSAHRAVRPSQTNDSESA